MNSDPTLCDSCGAVLDSAAPGGLCPRCLMAHAMQPTEPSLEAAREPPPSIETVQASFPQLEILEFVGQGGMGWVFKARQTKLNRFVALKLLPSSLAERDASFAGRFEREGQLLARLHHPNIVAVHDSGAAGGFFYLLMEYVEGVNLRQAMRSSRFTPAQALAIVPHICDALQFAHDEGVLHRDIKPENILLNGKGRVKLADFGIAKLIGENGTVISPLNVGTAAGTPAPLSGLTQSGATLGTPSYMAPEQRDTPGDVDNRADIYSLGVVFYELLTGELPIGSFAPPSTKSAADSRVDAIVQQALEKERTRRQSSAAEMKTQVETMSGTRGLASSADDDAQEQARKLVQGPAIGLRITGVLNCFVFAVIVIVMAPKGFGLPATFLVLLFAALLLSLFFGGLVIFAALQMMQLKAYRFAIAGSIFAILISPSSLVGLGIGIWSLIVLSRADVRNAFARQEREKIPSRPATPTERRLGAAALAVSVAAFPLALWIGMSGSWKTVIMSFVLLQLIVLVCGIAGRRFMAGKIAVGLVAIILVFGLPITAVILKVRLSQDFGGMPSLERLGSAKRPKVTVQNGPPFVAQLQQGTIELLALAPHPSANVPSWHPDGSPAKERFPSLGGTNSAAGKIAKEIAVHLRTHAGSLSEPVLRFEKESGISGMGSSLEREDKSETALTFVQAIACPPGAKSMNLKVGVAEGDWETVFSSAKPSVNMNSGWSGAQTSDIHGLWEGNVQMTEGKGGDVVLAFNYSVKDDFETRIAYVKTNGAVLPLKGNGSYGAGGLRNGIVSMPAADYSQIKEFQLQKRNYEWVEFRNVSLEPGHKTPVETVNAPGSATNNVEPASTPAATDVGQAAALSFGPVIKRFIAIGNAPESFYSISREGYTPGPQPPAPEEYKSLDWETDGQRMAQWLAINDVDFIVERKGGSLALVLVNMIASPCKEEDFDRYTAQDLSNDDGFKQWLTKQFRPNFQARDDGGKITEAFQTRHGRIGMVQVIGLSNNPLGLWIRYKLVNNTNGGHETQAAVPTPEAVTLMETMKALRDSPAYAPKAAITDPTQAIVMRVTQQQFEKTLTELQETQTALALLRETMTESHPQVKILQAKLSALQGQAERLRALIKQSAPMQ